MNLPNGSAVIGLYIFLLAASLAKTFARLVLQNFAKFGWFLQKFG